MSLHERARLVRVMLLTDRPRLDGWLSVCRPLSDVAVDDPAAFGLGLLSFVVRGAARRLP